jgi:hypothetical protein
MKFSKSLVLAVMIISLGGCSSETASTQYESSQPSSSAEPLTDQQLIENLYNSINENFAYGSEDGFNTVLDATYPGSVDLSISKRCLKTLVDTELQWFFEPHYETLKPVENWVSPDVEWDMDEWLFAGKTPKGRTYEMSVSGERIHNDEVISSPTGPLHFTILNEKAYMFTSLCASGW